GFLGDKNAKDVKELQKYVDLANEAGQTLSSLSIDELRAKTFEFKTKLTDATKDFKTQIEDLKKQVEETEDFTAKEDLYAQIDKINKQAYDVEEKILLEILPEAFAVMRETGKRFTENETLEVEASEFDKVLVNRGHDFVSLKNDTT
ncbi:MAG: preprotein translocase subunit SecA, partial [Algoriella sp.]